MEESHQEKEVEVSHLSSQLAELYELVEAKDLEAREAEAKVEV